MSSTEEVAGASADHTSHGQESDDDEVAIIFPPPAKKILNESLRPLPCMTLENMNYHVLKFQHEKLTLQVRRKEKIEQELKSEIEKLEKRQRQDDSVLNVINRYWNQLNEDIRILLERFDEVTSVEIENTNQSAETTSFLVQLSSLDMKDLEPMMANRVHVSTCAVAKIVQAFDRIQQRSAMIAKVLKDGEKLPNALSEEVKADFIELEAQNRKLQNLTTNLHEKNHVVGLQVKLLQDKLITAETKRDELKSDNEEKDWKLVRLTSDYNKSVDLVHNLQRQIQEKQGQRFCQFFNSQSACKELGDLSFRKMELNESDLLNLQRENEDLMELANNRLAELEQLRIKHQVTLEEREKLKIELGTLPEELILETTSYKNLQSRFSVVYNENLKLLEVTNEKRNLINKVVEDHKIQVKKMQTQQARVIKQLEDQLHAKEKMILESNKEFSKVQMELQHSQAVNCLPGAISQEMRQMIDSMKDENHHLKANFRRYRTKYKELCAKLKTKSNRDPSSPLLSTGEISSTMTDGDGDSIILDDNFLVLSPTSSPVRKKPKCSSVTEEHFQLVEQAKAETANVKELQSQVKQLFNERKELKLLLDMYKGASKEQRDKVQLMVSERRARDEIEELKTLVKQTELERRKEESKKLCTEESEKHIKMLEDQIIGLQKQVTAQKQEEEALIGEMELTGEAYEEVQEQNVRLIHQMREKDETNFKLVADRIRTNHQLTAMNSEAEHMRLQTTDLNTQIANQKTVEKELENYVAALKNTLNSMKKESSLRNQATELFKKKAAESAQCTAELKIHLDKCQAQLKESQQIVADKTCALEAEAYKINRLQEEATILKRKVERLIKIEMAGSTDKVIMEEIKEYKELLTCPSCKGKKKDAVLTKCFHVFCFDCLKTRYETRQRKCPKCNAPFGANDYHRLYLQ